MRPGGSTLGSGLIAARDSGRALLVPYLTAGYPDAEATGRALELFGEAGADAIELGVPFSDPLADGPVIAAASQRSLSAGMTVRGAIELGRARADGPPLILFTYLNPLLSLGPAGAASALSEAGFGGALVADLPFDEGEDVRAAFAAERLPLIPLAAPTTPPERLRELAGRAEGFVYLIARTGVTGAGSGSDRRLVDRIAALREVTELPIVIGFGIDGADSARRAAALADGIVVGSALVQRMGEQGAEAAAEWLAGLRAALDRG